MEKWHDVYEMKRFQFMDSEGIIVFPKNIRDTKDWVLKTEYWDAYPEIEIMLLEQGFHVAHLKTLNRWANKEDCDRKAAFVKYISQTYGLNQKCVPVGMSCGGAQAIKFAGYYPELVQCMFIEAPVMNFCSIPLRTGIDFNSMEVLQTEFHQAYPGLERYQLPGFNEHPICFAETLVKHQIPIVMSYGTHDLTVVWEENGQLLQEAYKGSELMKVIPVGFRGHHPHHALSRNNEIVEFILEHCS